MLIEQLEKQKYSLEPDERKTTALQNENLAYDYSSYIEIEGEQIPFISQDEYESKKADILSQL